MGKLNSTTTWLVVCVLTVLSLGIHVSDARGNIGVTSGRNNARGPTTTTRFPQKKITPNGGYDAPVVLTKSGNVQGTSYGSYEEFLQIPFAAPPVGENRWLAPQPPTPWNTTLQTTAYGPGCPQTCLLPEMMCPSVVSEDCLNLNVWTPSSSAETSLPVMVFFAGGAFFQGSGSVPAYTGETFATDGDVVTVTCDYRLGVFGFLVSEDQSVTGNFGILDQVAVLNWVQANIASFGGDPTQVTIFGQSAGAMSVAVHLTSPTSKGLFHRAIMESNPAALPYQDLELASKYGKKFAGHLGCDPTDLACMRSKTWEEVNWAGTNTSRLPDIFNMSLDVFLSWAPVIDNVNVLAQPIDLIAKGAYQQVPLVIGTNDNEGIMFVYVIFTEAITTVEYTGIVTALFGIENVVDIMNIYPGAWSFGDQNRPTLSRLLTDYLFYCPARYIAKASDQYATTFEYEFIQPLSFDPWGERYAMCTDYICHGSELPFVFNSASDLNYTWTANEQEVSNDMNAFWSNFATSSTADVNVGRNTTAPWPLFATATLESMQFGAPDHAITAFNATTCDFWDSLGYDF